MSFLHYLRPLWSIIVSSYTVLVSNEKLCIALIISCTFYLNLILYVISKTNVKAFNRIVCGREICRTLTIKLCLITSHFNISCVTQAQFFSIPLRFSKLAHFRIDSVSFFI